MFFKTLICRYVEKTLQWAVYTIGKEAFVVGLTSTVNKDSVTRGT